VCQQYGDHDKSEDLSLHGASIGGKPTLAVNDHVKLCGDRDQEWSKLREIEAGSGVRSLPGLWYLTFADSFPEVVISLKTEKCLDLSTIYAMGDMMERLSCSFRCIPVGVEGDSQGSTLQSRVVESVNPNQLLPKLERSEEFSHADKMLLSYWSASIRVFGIEPMWPAVSDMTATMFQVQLKCPGGGASCPIDLGALAGSIPAILHRYQGDDGNARRVWDNYRPISLSRAVLRRSESAVVRRDRRLMTDLVFRMDGFNHFVSHGDETWFGIGGLLVPSQEFCDHSPYRNHEFQAFDAGMMLACHLSDTSSKKIADESRLRLTLKNGEFDYDVFRSDDISECDEHYVEFGLSEIEEAIEVGLRALRSPYHEVPPSNPWNTQWEYSDDVLVDFSEYYPVSRFSMSKLTSQFTGVLTQIFNAFRIEPDDTEVRDYPGDYFKIVFPCWVDCCMLKEYFSQYAGIIR
jgi:hypothetical protein